MSKAFAKIAFGAAVVGTAFITGGASLVAAPGLLGVTVATTALGGLALTAGVGLALSGVTSAVGLGPKAPSIIPTALDRLNVTMVPSAPRKAVYGSPAMMVDMREVRS